MKNDGSPRAGADKDITNRAEAFGGGHGSRTRIIAEASLCCALSLILSFLTIFRMPQGGSISLEMAPLFFLAYRRGMRWGVAAGAVSGLLQMVLSGYIVHPIQALLDYPVAFACCGIAGFMPNRHVISTILSGFFRMEFHALSGVVFFTDFVPASTDIWLYSLMYNAWFMLPSLVISLIASLFALRRLQR